MLYCLYDSLPIHLWMNNFGYRKENYYTHLCKSLCVEAFFVFPWVNAQECIGWILQQVSVYMLRNDKIIFRSKTNILYFSSSM